MNESIPHGGIRERQDRSWTRRLLARLCDPGATEGERSELMDTLIRVADPRLGPWLIDAMEHAATPPEVREGIARLIATPGSDIMALPNRGTLVHRWWHGGDPVLERCALWLMYETQPQIVATVAADPAHRHHASAILILGVGCFEDPEFLRLKLRALAHPAPEVRSAAAHAVGIGAPIAAEAPLLGLLLDPSPEVVAEAASSLGRFRTRRSIAGLVGMEAHPSEAVRAAARASLEELRDHIARRLRSAPAPVAAALQSWMAALPANQQEAAGGSFGGSVDPMVGHAKCTLVADSATEELLANYADPDGPWAEKLTWFPSDSFADRYEHDRERLIPFFLRHPDPRMRSAGCGWLAKWNEHAGLMLLAEDPAYEVRTAALWALSSARRNPAVAETLFRRLRAGSEWPHPILHAYAAHAEAHELAAQLADLARADVAESLRVAAVWELVLLGEREPDNARAVLVTLLPLLTEAPRASWGVHVALLEAALTLAVSVPMVEDLLAFDDFDLEFAAICAATPSCRRGHDVIAHLPLVHR